MYAFLEKTWKNAKNPEKTKPPRSPNSIYSRMTVTAIAFDHDRDWRCQGAASDSRLLVAVVLLTALLTHGVVTCGISSVFGL